MHISLTLSCSINLLIATIEAITPENHFTYDLHLHLCTRYIRPPKIPPNSVNYLRQLLIAYGSGIFRCFIVLAKLNTPFY